MLAEGTLAICSKYVGYAKCNVFIMRKLTLKYGNLRGKKLTLETLLYGCWIYKVKSGYIVLLSESNLVLVNANTAKALKLLWQR